MGRMMNKLNKDDDLTNPNVFYLNLTKMTKICNEEKINIPK